MVRAKLLGFIGLSELSLVNIVLSVSVYLLVPWFSLLINQQECEMEHTGTIILRIWRSICVGSVPQIERTNK